MLILAVGITFLAIAAAVFLTVAFVTFSLTTKALITAAITLSTMGIASALRWRKLTATAEGVAVLGGILLTLDAWAIQALNFFGLGAAPQSLYWGVALSIISLLCVAWGWISHLRAPRIMAALACIPGATGLIVGIFGDTAHLPALIPLGVAGVIAGTGLLSRTPARPLEAGLVIAASHISALSVTITPWFSVPEPWAWTVIGQLAIVAALIGQMFLFGRHNTWAALNPLRYSAAILAAGAWMSALTYTAHRIEPTLSWAPAALAALAGLGLVIADAVIRPRARAAGLTAIITLATLWLPLLLGTTAWQVLEVMITRAFTAAPSTLTVESPELLAFGIATLISALCAAGLYALFGRGEAEARPRVERANLVAGVGVYGLVTTAWALPLPVASILLSVLILFAAVVGGIWRKPFVGVNVRVQADLLMSLSVLGALLTHEWGSTWAAAIGGVILVAGVARAVLTNAGGDAGELPTHTQQGATAALMTPTAPAAQPGTVVQPGATRAALPTPFTPGTAALKRPSALLGTSIALVGAFATQVHLLYSYDGPSDYVPAWGLLVGAILALAPLAWSKRLRSVDIGLFAGGATLVTLVYNVLLLLPAEADLRLNPGVIAATSAVAALTAGIGFGLLPVASAQSRGRSHALAVPLPWFIAAALGALGHLITQRGSNRWDSPWIALGEAPTVLGVAALLAAAILLVLAAVTRRRAPAQTIPAPAQTIPDAALATPDAALHHLSSGAVSALVLAGLQVATMLGLFTLAFSTVTLYDGVGLLAVVAALVTLGGLLGRQATAGPPVAWAGAAVAALLGPVLLDTALNDPWPLLVIAPLTLALAASALGFVTRPASHARGGQWVLALLASGSIATLLASTLLTASTHARPWLIILTLLASAALSVGVSLLRLPERFLPAMWASGLAAGVGAAASLGQLMGAYSLPDGISLPLTIFAVALIVGLPARRAAVNGEAVMIGEATAAPALPAPKPAEHSPVSQLPSQQPASTPGQPAASAAAAPSGSVIDDSALRGVNLTLLADILIAGAVAFFMAFGAPSGLFAGLLILGAGAGAALGALMRTLVHLRLADTQAERPHINLWSTPIGAAIAASIIGSLTILNGTHALHQGEGSEHAGLRRVLLVIQIEHTLIALLVLLAAGAVFLLSRRAAQDGAQQPWTLLARLSLSALPAALWATLGDLPLLGDWHWWPLAVGSGLALASAASVFGLRTRPGHALALYAGLAALALPVISLIVTGTRASDVGVAGLFTAFAGTAILYGAPPQWPAASIRGLRAGALALAYGATLLIFPEVPANWQPLLTAVPAGLAALNTAALRFFGKVAHEGDAVQAGRERELYSLWDQRIYAFLAPLIAVSSLVIVPLGSEATAALWWTSGYAVILSALGVGLSLWMAGSALGRGAPLEPLSVRVFAQVSAHLAAVVALAGFSAKRTIAGGSSGVFGAQIGGVDYALGIIVILTALASLAVTSWTIRVDSTWQAHLMPALHSGAVSVAAAVTAVMISNEGLFRTLSVGQHFAYGALSVLAALTVVAVLTSLLRPFGEDTVRSVSLRALIAGILAALAGAYSFMGSLVSGMGAEIELFAVPLGITLLVAGLVAVRGERRWRSWLTFGPALIALIVVPLAAEVATPTAWRIGLVTILVVTVIVIGARMSLQAPLLAGSIAAIIHAVIAVRTALPNLVIPWWVWLSIAGVILVVVASTYEARLRDARRLGEAVRALR
ncbi:SCO7613 C-terminal domain-containing membrane protein [Schaalia sp. Marseille-Q2122]|uniref:SCO7613 C-terminal domain-containing membrane protein n=1 Tax=Schaalia sp. Marseille-Q2122 TaxID=2736604 RepID=UPI00158B17D5|nr:hypothetical protein [Schaalia sp. Marseille-Q2122]